MIFGYARVSTITQCRDGNSLENQIAALKEYGCTEIITEAYTGKTVDRPEFAKLLARLQEGDTLVVACFGSTPCTHQSASQNHNCT